MRPGERRTRLARRRGTRPGVAATECPTRCDRLWQTPQVQMIDSDQTTEGACEVADPEDPLRRADFDPDGADRPVLVWDGDCGFCRRSLDWVRARAGDALHYAPYQRVGDPYSDIGLSESDFERAVHLIEPDGVYYSGAEAIFRALDRSPEGSLLPALYDRLPGFARLTERLYRFVAEHRPLCNRIATVAVGDPLEPARWRAARWLFLRAVAVVVVVAFVSLAVQIPGLIGESGIQPATDFIDRIHGGEGEGGAVSFWKVPTLFWWVRPTTSVLRATCWLGAGLGIVLAFGVFQRLSLAAIWGLYLSLSSVAGPFLGYQWDTLVLEMSFLSIFLAPAGPRPRGGARPVPRAARWMLYWLLFRLVFMSGVVKLTSGDPTWWGMTALEYHFWTQPLPAWTAYWVHFLPAALLVAGAVWTFVAELIVPFGIFGPRRIRRVAAALIGVLQIGIALTGNYGFFNLATLSLCLLLVDDRWWLEHLPDWAVRDRIEHPDQRPVTAQPGAHQRGLLGLAFAGRSGGGPQSGDSTGGRGVGPIPAARGWLAGAVAAGVLTLTAVDMFDRFYGREANPLPVPSVVRTALDAAAPFRTLNTYGLFADMTERRPELIVQGSRDGEHWRTYQFQWKPDALDERPPFVQPHQPRLDWQMWFQALRWFRVHEGTGECGQSRWFVQFQRRLLQGRTAVLELLGRVPFEDRPPEYVRTVAWEYEFAPPDDGAERWWQRTRLGQWCPTLTLTSEGRLRAVRPETGR